MVVPVWVSVAGGVRRFHPLAKFVLLCAHAIAVLSAPGIAAKVGFVLLPIVLGGRRLAGRRAFHAAVSFGGFLFVLQALVVPGTVVARLGPLTVTAEGLRMGGEMALRFLGVLGGSLLFVAVTSPEEFASAVSRTRLPYRYTYVLVLALRFLPLFRHEYVRVREAQYMRGLTLRPWRLPSHVRWTVLPVLASALARAEGVALAMQAKGFGLHRHRTSLEHVPWGTRDTLLVGLAGLVASAAGWFLAGGGATWP
ncbi:MAG: energy-coupling factor transporter transmembrane component T [Candidatus Bipolaricaulota bacterium]